MKPQEDFNEKKDEQEEELLRKKVKELRPDDIQRLFEQGITFLFSRITDYTLTLFYLKLIGTCND